MSFSDRLVLWLHIGFAIFTIGPVTVAISSTPRYVRKRNLAVVQYLYRMTRVFTILSLGVLIAGLFLAQIDKDFSKPWLAVSGTLFVVAIALLVLIMRDQHRAIGALQAAGPEAVLAPAADGTAVRADGGEAHGGADRPGTVGAGTAETLPGRPTSVAAAHLAAVERGRIATMGGVVSVIWLVILVLMVWNS
jgi:hypothetical protein